MHGKPKVILRSGAKDTITLTITANEANLSRLANILLFATRPGDDDLDMNKGLYMLPWEDPNDARYIGPPKSTEQLQEEAAAKVTSIINTWTNGLADVKLTLAKFGVDRVRELKPEQLESFIQALDLSPSLAQEAPEKNDPDELV
jgi:hypothetical protein